MKWKKLGYGFLFWLVALSQASADTTVWGQRKHLYIQRNQDGRVSEIRYPSLQKVQYRYDESGDLTAKTLLNFQNLPQEEYFQLEPADALFYEGVREEFGAWLNRPLDSSGKMIFPTAEEFLIRFFRPRDFRYQMVTPAGFIDALKMAFKPENPSTDLAQIQHRARQVFKELVLTFTNAKRMKEHGSQEIQGRIRDILNDENRDLDELILETVPLIEEILEPHVETVEEQAVRFSDRIPPDSDDARQILKWIRPYESCAGSMVQRVRAQLGAGKFYRITDTKMANDFIFLPREQPFEIAAEFPGLSDRIFFLPRAFNWNERDERRFLNQFEDQYDTKARNRRKLLIGNPTFSFKALGKDFDYRIGWLVFFSNYLEYVESTQVMEYFRDFRMLSFLTSKVESREAKHLRKKIAEEYFPDLSYAFRGASFYTTLDELAACLKPIS